MNIGILHYDSGNIKSVQQALIHLGHMPHVISSAKEIEKTECLMIPGQGAFKSAMTYLRNKQLVTVIKDHILSSKPFIGICLGFQLLFQGSDENGGEEGLGLFPGHFVKFDHHHLKIPHMGWNTLQISPGLFSEFSPYFYFIHSYFLPETDPDLVFSTTTYGCSFVSGIYSPSLLALQCHPEKSGKSGLKLLKEFLNRHG